MLRVRWMFRLLCTALLLCPTVFAQDSEITPPGNPAVQQILPAPGETLRELFSVEVQFDRPVDGVDAGDLLVNGQTATEVTEVVDGHFLFTVPSQPPGPVQLQWRADHGIQDANGTLFTTGAWSYIVDPKLAPQVIISEFMASNRRSLRDSDGDSPDWVELFNPAEEEVDLEGWSLTTSPADPTPWQFPAVSIPAKGYLIVFASEKDRRDPAQELHTHFKLSDNGEFLALLSPEKTIISAFSPAYPAQTTDISYGRAQGAPESVGFFSKPTPGQANSTSGAGFGGEVQFSMVSGIYSNAFLLTLSADATNAAIRYTLNGALPTNTSTLYTGPIPITNTTIVRARAFQDRLLPGPVRTENFAFFANLQSFTSTLPILLIQTIGRAPVATIQTTSEFSVFPPRNGVATLTNNPDLRTRAGVKLRGSSTRGLAKSSYSLELWDEFENSHDLSLVGLPAESDWVLYAPNQYDPIMIHNPFAYELSRQIGQYSPRTRFVEVFVQTRSGSITSNNYNGIYVLEEKIKVGDNRVNIDKLRPQNLTTPTITGGYLLKVDRTGPGESGFPGAGTTVINVDPKEREVRQTSRRPQDTYLRNYFASFGRALTGTNWLDPETGYRAFIDETSWIEYHVLEVLSGNVDSLVLSCYFHKPREGKLTFGPHWDFDRALGSTDGRDSNPRNWATGPFFSAPWWNRMLRDRDFWQHWVDRWQELRKSTFALDHLHALIDSLSGELREAQPRETRRWRIALRGNNGYQGEIDHMKNWLSNRIDFIDRQLTQPAIPSVLPGQVAPGTLIQLNAQPAATIYYTLDGTDPRLPQGELSPEALLYTGPIAVDKNIRLFARARNLNQRQTGGPPSSTPWSGPTTGSYFIQSPHLLVTEINFHPVAPAGATNPASDYEFLEMKNAGSEDVDLSGLELSGGISFSFPRNGDLTILKPGERFLLVKNQAAFQQVYPGKATIAGEYLRSLANSGDRLTLRGPMGEPIFDFHFAESWQAVTDGLGFTLTLADETIPPGALGNSRHWRASSIAGGSPGSADPGQAFASTVLVNEVLSNPGDGAADAVELYNAADQAVDISGWFLTDDPRSPFKYRIPAQTSLGPKSYFVVTDAQFGKGDTGFGLSAEGDAVYLFAATPNGQLTGYYHGLQFGPMNPGESFGLFTSSDGQQHLLRQARPTLGFVNAAPEIGPVVISEIMYGPNSESRQGEFIELVNITDQPVALHGGAIGSAWRLRGGVEYDFPPGTIIPPGGAIVVTAINPANQFFANQFRSRYGLPIETPLLGPWTGTLANEGDSIRLDHPVQINGNTLSDSVVDSVTYSPESPWPNIHSHPGSTGLYSIARLQPALFGDDPANWIAALPSPAQPDADRDGLPDWWETLYNFDSTESAAESGPWGDPDQDGFPNYQEFLAGTMPRDANSFLYLDHTVASNNVTLNFAPLPGRSYSIYYTDDLASNSWHPLRNFSLVTNTVPITVRDLTSRRARFYKLQLP